MKPIDRTEKELPPVFLISMAEVEKTGYRRGGEQRKVGGDLDAWARSLVTRPGRKVVIPSSEADAELLGLGVQPARPGEWYASPDIPSSPIAGALSGVELGALPPLAGVLPTTLAGTQPPLLVQLRGAGTPEAALQLVERPTGRVAYVLASGFWRWASRPSGREPYRRIWSGVAGWLLADQVVSAAEPRPTEWVIARGDPVTWSMPADSVPARIVVRAQDSTVVDTVVGGGRAVTTGVLEPGSYSFLVERSSGDTLSSGRFDVARGTEDMLPVAGAPLQEPRLAGLVGADGGVGRPLRTQPWPYLFVLALLCLEWVGRRRSGLR
jgi:hypothetical protein